MITVKLWRDNRGTVLKLPCTESEMETALKRIRDNGTYPPEPLVAAILPKELSVLEDRYVNLDELNYLAKRMESFNENELMKFYSVVAVERYAEMENLINLTFNLNCYTLIRDVSRLEAVGKTLMFDLQGGIREAAMTTEEYVSAGRELLASGAYTPTAYGLLHKNGLEMEQVYDGRVFPNYAYHADWQLNLAIEHHGRTEYLFLPDENTAIQKALYRLGASYPEECQICVEDANLSDGEWSRYLEEVRKEEGLYELNELMQAVDPRVTDMDKLLTVIRYAKAGNAVEVMRLAEHLDEFGFIQSADDKWEIGRELFVSEFGIEINAALRGFFDFEAFGKAMMEKLGGEFIDGGGYVYLTGEKKLEEIMHPEEENTIADYYAGEMIGNRK